MNINFSHIFNSIILLIAIVSIGACKQDPLLQQAEEELQQTLRQQPEFVKVHAAEFLLWLGQTEVVKKEFLKENELHGGIPRYRIGIWRVLAQTETEPAKKKMWEEKVLGAFGDLNGPDRLHAAETLAKLKLSPMEKYPEATEKAVSDTSRNMQVYTHWALSYAPGADTSKFRKDFLHFLATDTNDVVRLISAYILRRQKGLTKDDWLKLSQVALAEPQGSGLRKNLLNTVLVTVPEASLQRTPGYGQIRKEATANYQQNSYGQRIELAQALAEIGGDSDIPLLTSYLNNENANGFYEADTKEAADVRAAAAYAILKIKNVRLSD